VCCAPAWVRGWSPGELALTSTLSVGVSALQVVPSLLGDATFTNAMRLEDLPAWTAAAAAGLLGPKQSTLPSPFDHTRFYSVEVGQRGAAASSSPLQRTL
jgi:hypothetical protein